MGGMIGYADVDIHCAIDFPTFLTHFENRFEHANAVLLEIAEFTNGRALATLPKRQTDVVKSEYTYGLVH